MIRSSGSVLRRVNPGLCPVYAPSLTQQLCTATVAAGRGGDDLAVLITTLEKMAGLSRP